MRGDVVLFKSSGSLFDRTIEWATHGPYVHVEIDLGNGRMIGAHNEGIIIHQGTAGRNTTSFRPRTSDTDLEYGSRWAELQAGKQYGWTDIISNGIKLLGVPIIIGEPGHWNCSDFVTRYLLVARASSPLGSRAEDPGLVSPNDIARAYGVK
jgi:hypothetical protein